MKNIRNFTIIAHIDHGKSTLADRMLEVTRTVEKRKMREQVLDSMELERERGITIKMQPVRMEHNHEGQDYVLNLIDTPGHIDFSYEVSRALKAVEGSILLVDATQGVQAQTLTTLRSAKELGLEIIPVITKVDSKLARIPEVKKEVADLLEVKENEVLEVSGKTGQGVEELLREVIKRVPSPENTGGFEEFRGLVFDFEYSTHRGVIVYVRVFNGEVASGDEIKFASLDKSFTVSEVGVFMPEEKKMGKLCSGEIGYIVTGIKEPGLSAIGDTITLKQSNLPPLAGYEIPKSVVWASIFPESQDDFFDLKNSLERLRLSDASLSFDEESSGVLGRGFRVGFLGMLHMEITIERLKREYGLDIIITSPSISYNILTKDGDKKTIYSPIHFPPDGEVEKVWEPWIEAEIITPNKYMGGVMTLIYSHGGEVGETKNFGDERSSIHLELPLRELMRDFFDELKSVSSGYASLSYESSGMREANVTKLEVLVADEPVPAFTRIISKERVEEEAKGLVERLYKHLPRQMFVTKIQAKALGRIISSRTLKAFKKDVTAKLYGGDITRKMKLREKQKKGKKRMKERGKVNIPHEVFVKMMRSSDQ